jgi:hypothetical protein
MRKTTADNAEEFSFCDELKATFRRLTGKDFDDLPLHIQARFYLAPPDIDWGDILFCLEPPPQAPWADEADTDPMVSEVLAN